MVDLYEDAETHLDTFRVAAQAVFAVAANPALANLDFTYAAAAAGVYRKSVDYGEPHVVDGTPVARSLMLAGRSTAAVDVAASCFVVALGQPRSRSGDMPVQRCIPPSGASSLV